jgi:hypothetical protein
MVPQVEVVEMPYAAGLQDAAAGGLAAMSAHAPVSPRRMVAGSQQHVYVVDTASASRTVLDRAFHIFKQTQANLSPAVKLLVIHVGPHKGSMLPVSTSNMTAVQHVLARSYTELQIHMHVCKVCWLMPIHSGAARQQRLAANMAAAAIVMVGGCIPVAFVHSELPAVIRHSVEGFVIRKSAEYAKYTLDVYKRSSTMYNSLRRAVQAKAEVFMPSAFDDKLSVLARRGL